MTLKDKLLITLACNYPFNENIEAVNTAVEEYTSALLQQCNVSSILEFLNELLDEEYKAAIAAQSETKSGQHYANTTSIEDTMELIRKRQASCC